MPSLRLPAGTVLANYRIEGFLGEGGMGVVYRATQLSLNRPVALKLLSSSLADDAEGRARFVQEGRLAARVVHPNLVTVFEVAEHGGRLLLACELIEDETLRNRLDRDGALLPAAAVAIAASCAEALAALHDAGIVHRDLKPANIFISPGRGAIVGDLGIAKDRLGGGPGTRTGVILGTPAYMSPELAGGRPASSASDIYALGVVFFECLTGRPPFEGTDAVELLRRHWAEPIPRISEWDARFTPEYDRLFEGLLAKKPEDRPSDARTVAAALQRLPPVSAGGPSRQRRPRPGPATVSSGPSDQAAGRSETRVVSRNPSGRPAALSAVTGDMRTFGRPRAGWVGVAAGVALLLLVYRGSRSGPHPAGKPDPHNSVVVTAPVRPKPASPVLQPLPIETEVQRFMAVLVPSVATDRDRWPEVDNACRAMRRAMARLIQYHLKIRSDPLAIPIAEASRLTGEHLLGGLDSLGGALRALAPKARIRVPGASLRVGQILASASLVYRHSMDVLKHSLNLWAKARSELIVSEERARGGGQVHLFAQRVAAWADGIDAAVAKDLAGLEDPVLKAGLCCLQAMESPRGSGEQRRAEYARLQDATIRAFDRLTDRPAGGQAEFVVARALMETLRERLTHVELLSLVRRAAERIERDLGLAAGDPSTELFVYEVDRMATTLTAMTSVPGEARQRDKAELLSRVRSRDRLILRWPYDPRTVPPVGGGRLFDEARRFDLDARARIWEQTARVAVLALGTGMDFPKEPQRPGVPPGNRD